MPTDGSPNADIDYIILYARQCATDDYAAVTAILEDLEMLSPEPADIWDAEDDFIRLLCSSNPDNLPTLSRYLDVLEAKGKLDQVRNVIRTILNMPLGHHNKNYQIPIIETAEGKSLDAFYDTDYEHDYPFTIFNAAREPRLHDLVTPEHVSIAIENMLENMHDGMPFVLSPQFYFALTSVPVVTDDHTVIFAQPDETRLIEMNEAFRISVIEAVIDWIANPRPVECTNTSGADFIRRGENYDRHIFGVHSLLSYIGLDKEKPSHDKFRLTGHTDSLLPTPTSQPFNEASAPRHPIENQIVEAVKEGTREAVKVLLHNGQGGLIPLWHAAARDYIERFPGTSSSLIIYESIRAGILNAADVCIGNLMQDDPNASYLQYSMDIFFPIPDDSFDPENLNRLFCCIKGDRELTELLANHINDIYGGNNPPPPQIIATIQSALSLGPR